MRGTIFLALFAALAVAEYWRPRRIPALLRRKRWPLNLTILAIDIVIVRALFPAAAVGIALMAEDRSIGILNALDMPALAAIAVAFVALDLLVYGQHVLFHAVPALWRIHRVHHADPDFDVTTGVRFHPLEIVLSMLIKSAAILLMGAPAVAVLAFEIALNGSSLFSHANFRLPPRIDSLLRSSFVTPDMHRVHHSIRREETDSNFGFNLSWWDRLFGTYRDQPRGGHETMTIGIRDFCDEQHCATMRGVLLMPFVSTSPHRRSTTPESRSPS